MGRLSRPGVRFTLRTQQTIGNLGVRISYEGKQYTGSLKIPVPVADFSRLNTNGTLKDPNTTNRPKTFIGNLDLSDLLQIFASEISMQLNRHIDSGKQITQAYVSRLIEHCASTYEKQIYRWIGLILRREVLPEMEGKCEGTITKYLNRNWRNFISPLADWNEDAPEQEGGEV